MSGPRRLPAPFSMMASVVTLVAASVTVPMVAPVAILAFVPAASGASAEPRVEQPGQAYGLTLGDVLVQRVRLDGGVVDAMPPVGRVDRWLERLSARELDGVLELQYQITNSPERVRVATLPRVEIAMAYGGSIAVEPWPIAFGPIAPASDEALPASLPDRPSAAPDVEPLRRERGTALLALGATLVAWLGWWVFRRARDAVRLPFAGAVRALGGLPRAGRDERPEAWAALHRAIDRSAGTTVHAGSLDTLLREAPWIAPWRTRLEAFYAASTARFFAQPPRAEPFEVTALCRELERAERARSVS